MEVNFIRGNNPITNYEIDDIHNRDLIEDIKIKYTDVLEFSVYRESDLEKYDYFELYSIHKYLLILMKEKEFSEFISKKRQKEHEENEENLKRQKEKEHEEILIESAYQSKKYHKDYFYDDTKIRDITDSYYESIGQQQ